MMTSAEWLELDRVFCKAYREKLSRWADALAARQPPKPPCRVACGHDEEDNREAVGQVLRAVLDSAQVLP